VSSPSALRALETARVYRLLGDPLVIVSGGSPDADAKALSEAEAIPRRRRRARLCRPIACHRIGVQEHARGSGDPQAAAGRAAASIAS
jgi:hypothetical protein